MVTLQGEKLNTILRTVVNEKIPAIMSYLSKGKWHVAKVLLTDMDGDRLIVESIRAIKKQRPINIQVDQPVGISFKHEYGKFVFDTTVIGLELSPDRENNRDRGGSIVLTMPEKMEVVQRRSYFRVEVPQTLKVKALLWHRSSKEETTSQIRDRTDQIQRCYQGRLLDISAGGAQIVVPYQNIMSTPTSLEQEIKPDESGDSVHDPGKPNFKKGQFVGVRFTPIPYETPLTFSAQIRNILPTADGQGISLGLQIVGLEASPEGHQALTRLIAVVGSYYQMNQTGGRKPDRQPITNAV